VKTLRERTLRVDDSKPQTFSRRSRSRLRSARRASSSAFSRSAASLQQTQDRWTVTFWCGSGQQCSELMCSSLHHSHMVET